MVALTPGRKDATTERVRRLSLSSASQTSTTAGTVLQRCGQDRSVSSRDARIRCFYDRIYGEVAYSNRTPL